MNTDPEPQFQIYNDRQSGNLFFSQSFESQLSFMSSDSDETYDKYEEELFSNGNPFHSPVTPITPLTPNKNITNFNNRSEERFIKRPSMRIIHDDNTSKLTKSQINKIASSYDKNKNSPHKSSKSSKPSITSLHDITNFSSARSSIRQNSSTSNLRSFSLQKNESALSIEKKKNKIIRNLNKRNSKNLENPYFYQYKEDEAQQPKVKLPDLPEAPLDGDVTPNVQQSQRIVDLSETSSFSEFSSQMQPDDSFHFVDDKVLIKSKLGNFAHSQNPQITEQGNSINQNTNRDANNQDRNQSNDNNNEYHELDPNNTILGGDRDDSRNSGNDSNNTSGNRTNGTGSSGTENTDSSDLTTSTKSSENYRNSNASVIKRAQRNSSGVFVEFSPTKSLSFSQTNRKNQFINRSESYQNSSRRDSDITVATENLNFEKIIPNDNPNRGSSNTQYRKTSTLLSDLSIGSIPEDDIAMPDTVITIKNINEHQGIKEIPNEEENKTIVGNTPQDFNLNNNSTSSILPKIEQTAKPITILPKISDESPQLNKNTKTLHQKRKPVPLQLADNLPPPSPVVGFDISSEDHSVGHSSQGSREELLTNEKDLEAQNESKYYESNYVTECSNVISIILIMVSFIAPPFWLMIGLGYLDSSFGKIEKKYKIISLVLFGIFVVGAIVGIGVGFGYGLTHKS